MTYDPELLEESVFVADDGTKREPLTKKCPNCGGPLAVNMGVHDWVYFCPKKRCGDVTKKVEQVFSKSVEEASFVTTTDFPRELQRFAWAAFA